MTLTLVQVALWTLLLLTTGRVEYVPMRGTFDVVSEDGNTIQVGRAGLRLEPDGRCLLYVHVDENGIDTTPDDIRLHEMAHALDCLDNKALDGSPMPVGADRSIIPNIPGCQRNAAEQFACWYVANVERGVIPAAH